MTIIEQLQQFIKDAETGDSRNLWIADDDMQVYIRKGHHLLPNGKIATTLDIANVTVEPSKQRKGLWTAFLAKAQEINPWEGVYVECVHTPYLAMSLMKQGWIGVNNNESFFMPKDMVKYQSQQRLQRKFNHVF